MQLTSPDRRSEALALIAGVLGDGIQAGSDPTSISVNVPDAGAAAAILSALAGANIGLTDFALGAPSLDDVFFALTGRAAESTAAPQKEPAS
jgi:ABC-2 type transport system ATP-binding protein